MKRCLLFAGLLAFTFLNSHLLAQSASPTPSAKGKDDSNDGSNLEKTWSKIEKRSPDIASVNLMSFALEATAHNWHPERVTQALAILTTMQDRDPASKTYGNFSWFLLTPLVPPRDPNAVQFTMKYGILFWNLYRSSLSAHDLDLLRQLIDFSVHGIENQHVRVEYTNIFLMKSWNCIAIGEALGDPKMAEEGYRMLDQWIDFTYHNGLTEYLSPTYNAVDLDMLTLIAKYAGRTKGQAEAEAALRYMWLQLRANWFPPDQRLGGAHSRDYDYLTGHGPLDTHVAAWGWIPDLKISPDDQPTFSKLMAWQPPDMSSYASVWATPRFVWQRCGVEPDRYATQYVGPSVSIGAAGTSSGTSNKSNSGSNSKVSSGSSGSDGKIFTINFDGGPEMVMANYFMDGRGDFYGQNKVVLKDTHIKALHLVPFITSAQVGPNVLFFSSFGSPASNPDSLKDHGPGLYSHLDLPVEAAVWQGGVELKVPSGQSAPLDPVKPVFLRYKGTAIGLKFIQATDVTGKPISPVYYRDGDAYHAARISWTHAAPMAQGEAHVLFLASAAENLDDPGFQHFQEQFSATKITFQFQDNKISAQAEMADHSTLVIGCDLQTGEKTLPKPQPQGILRVNGVEVGQPVLAEALKNPSAQP